MRTSIRREASSCFALTSPSREAGPKKSLQNGAQSVWTTLGDCSENMGLIAANTRATVRPFPCMHAALAKRCAPFRTSLHVTRVAHALLAPNPADIHKPKYLRPENIQKKCAAELEKRKAEALASAVQSPSSSSTDGPLSAGQRNRSNVYVAAHPTQERYPPPPPPDGFKEATFTWSRLSGWQLPQGVPYVCPFGEPQNARPRPV